MADPAFEFKKGDAILTTDGKALLVYEDSAPEKFKVWVNAPGESPFEIRRSEIAGLAGPTATYNLIPKIERDAIEEMTGLIIELARAGKLSQLVTQVKQSLRDNNA